MRAHSLLRMCFQRNKQLGVRFPIHSQPKNAIRHACVMQRKDIADHDLRWTAFDVGGKVRLTIPSSGIERMSLRSRLLPPLRSFLSTFGSGYRPNQSPCPTNQVSNLKSFSLFFRDDEAVPKQLVWS